MNKKKTKKRHLSILVILRVSLKNVRVSLKNETLQMHANASQLQARGRIALELMNVASILNQADTTFCSASGLIPGR